MGRGRFLPKGLLVLLALVAGCGLFEPRDPREPEDQIPTERCRAQSAPDSVIANVVAHYALGTDCYRNQLADSLDPFVFGFRFRPDLQDSLARENPPAPNPYSGWNKAVEVSVTQAIATSYDTVIVFFDPNEYAGRVTTADRETRFYNYRVRTVNGPADTTTYQGQVELTMVRRTSNWFLETFRDHRDGSGLETWGALRALHRSGL